MSFVVFDIETDGLEATKVHCLSHNTGPTLTDDGGISKFLTLGHTYIGHNIQRYDIPTIKRLFNLKLKVRAIDTLALSWYLYPDRQAHSLESWGETFGIPKIKVDDWTTDNIELYVARCERDVEINTRLWEMQLEALRRLYKSDQEALRLAYYLSFKMHCAALQEASRCLVDTTRVEEGINQLQQAKEEKVQGLKAAMPKVPKEKTKTIPLKPFKQDGTLSAHGEKWFGLLKELGLPSTTASVKVIDHYEDPNPSSHDQIKNYLFSLGWKPDEFKYVPDEDSPTKTRMIPQVNTKRPGEWGLTESVKRLVEKFPELEPLDGLSVISHRLSILEGFRDNVDSQGYIKAEIAGFTNTLRFKHSVVVNLPKVTTPYGELVRGCLIAPQGYELCGSDMSSLEDRTKQHYIYPHDPEYVQQMQTPGYDPHLALAVSAGAMTEEESDGYKAGTLKKLFSAIRSMYKTTNYAATYGAGGKKIALSAGVEPARGYQLHEAYWKKNWAIIAVADESEVKTLDGQKWLFNPVSRFWYCLRNDKDRFSTLNQSTGVFCFDTWIKKVLSKREQLTATFHDEGVWTIKKGHRDDCTKLLTDAIRETNEELKLNVQLAIDIQFGERYSEIH